MKIINVLANSGTIVNSQYVQKLSVEAMELNARQDLTMFSGVLIIIRYPHPGAIPSYIDKYARKFDAYVDIISSPVDNGGFSSKWSAAIYSAALRQKKPYHLFVQERCRQNKEVSKFLAIIPKGKVSFFRDEFDVYADFHKFLVSL